MDQSTSTAPAPPGPRFLNPLGGLLPLRRDVLDYATRTCLQYGGVTAIRAANIRVVFITRPESCEYILRTNQDNFRKGVSYQKLRHIMGNGLLVADGPAWKQQRKLAQPYFNRPVVLGYRDQIRDATARLISRLERAADRDEPIDMFAQMDLAAFDLVGKTLFGADIQAEMAIIERFLPDVVQLIYNQIQSPVSLPLWLPLPSHRRFNKAERELNAVVYRIIEKRRTQQGQSNDLLSKLLAAADPDTGEGLSSRQLRDEIMSAMLAGYETTADGMAWCLYFLARNPAVAKTLQREVDRVLGERMASSDDLTALPYTGQVIDETLRIIPPAWSFTREARAPDTINGYAISPGDMIVVSPYVLHRWPDLWPEPERFLPERFEPAAVKARNRWHYLPFGAGAHGCIGKHLALVEMKTVIAALAQRFEFSLAPGARVVMDPGITIQPKYGLPMRVRRRPGAAAVTAVAQ